jgi:isoleucyl-tRNA synthetase
VGVNVKDADAAICELLKTKGRLVQKAKLLHSYPFCWRSDTPLIYKAVPSWFVAVESIKDKLLANNAGTYWVPNFVKEGRFHNWLADARDWAISRNRFWGTPIPIWASADYSEVVAIGSVADLETKAGLPPGSVTDLHRESIDHITIPSKTPGAPPLHRVDEVFDCWFESGSMPYAQQHYPFENKERFEKGFPAHFIAEGLDQTRGWFYTLMVLSTALFDKPAFTNLIVNGMVLASDGKKMSKRLKNYPDPNEVIKAYGADALRMYLINSPVVRAEPLKFKEDGVKGVVRDVMIPWYNAFRFMVQQMARWQDSLNSSAANGGNGGSAPTRTFRPDPALAAASTNPIDIWIRAEVQTLVAFVHQEMEGYRLYTVMPRLVAFLDQLTKWFVRLNRDRLKGTESDLEAAMGLSVLFGVLETVTALMAPFTPFFAEVLYQKLRRLSPLAADNKTPDSDSNSEQLGLAASIHFVQLPRPDANHDAALAQLVTQEMVSLQLVVELGRKAREAKGVSLKKPVKEIVVVVGATSTAAISGLAKLDNYLKAELNAAKITVTASEDEWCNYSATCNFGALGKRCGKAMPSVKAAVQSLSHQDMANFRRTGSVELEGFQLTGDELVVNRSFKGDASMYSAVEADDGSVVVAVNLEEDQSTTDNWLGRELVAVVQKLRKSGGLLVGDGIEVFYKEETTGGAAAGGKGGGAFAAALANPEVSSFVAAKLGGAPLPWSALPAQYNLVGQPVLDAEVHTSKLSVAIARPQPAVSSAALQKAFPDMSGKTLGAALALAGGALAGPPSLACPEGSTSMKLFVDGHALTLAKGVHYFDSATAAAAAAGQ